jgi:hypothetical protein
LTWKVRISVAVSMVALMAASFDAGRRTTDLPTG